MKKYEATRADYSETFENFPKPYAAGYQSFIIVYGQCGFADMVTKTRKAAIDYIMDNGYKWKLYRTQKNYDGAEDYVISIQEKSNKGDLS